MRDLLAPGQDSESEAHTYNSALPDEYTTLGRICAYFDEPHGPKLLSLDDYGAALAELAIAPCNSYWGSLEEIELAKRVHRCTWTQALDEFAKSVDAEPLMTCAAIHFKAKIKGVYLAKVAQYLAQISEQLALAFEAQDQSQKRLIQRWRESSQQTAQSTHAARTMCSQGTKHAFVSQLTLGLALQTRAKATNRQNLTALVAHNTLEKAHIMASNGAKAMQVRFAAVVAPLVARMRFEVYIKEQAPILKRRILKHIQVHAAALRNSDTTLRDVSRLSLLGGPLAPPVAVASHALRQMSTLAVSAKTYTLQRKKQLLRHWLGSFKRELLTSVWAVRAVRRILHAWRMHAAALLLHNLSTLRTSKELVQGIRANSTRITQAEGEGATILYPQMASALRGLKSSSQRAQADANKSEALEKFYGASLLVHMLDVSSLGAQAAERCRINLGRLAVQHLRAKLDAVLAAKAAQLDVDRKRQIQKSWLVGAVVHARALEANQTQSRRVVLKPAATQLAALSECISQCSDLAASTGRALSMRTLGQTAVAAVEQVLQLESDTEFLGGSYSAQISADLMRSAVVVAQRLRLRWAEVQANRVRSERQLWRRAIGAWHARAVPREPGTPRSAKLPPSVLRRMQSAGATAGTPTARPGSPSTPRRLLFRPSSSPARYL